MLVLIVTKTTNYELHGAVIESKVAAGRVTQETLSRLQAAHREHYETLSRLRTLLSDRGIEFDEVSRDFPRPWSKPYDLVITVGGDGTLLAASHQMASGGLIVGVRSSPSSVGYLCCAGLADLERLVRVIASGQQKVTEVHRVRAWIHRLDQGTSFMTEPVLNDMLYTNANPAATTRYQITFGPSTEVHRSSGIWVATAIGSTAAILAAGGQRRPPEEREFQFKVRELYRLGLTAPAIDGGLFDPAAEPMTGPHPLVIENRCPSAILALDGQHGSLELTYGDRIEFLRAPSIRLIQTLAD